MTLQVHLGKGPGDLHQGVTQANLGEGKLYNKVFHL